jgi:Mrp family chromosome partitioning ATPase
MNSMSENLRKFNQDSSHVSLNELEQLNQVVAVQAASSRGKKKLDGKSVHFLATMPDYSSEEFEKPATTTSRPNVVQPQIAPPTVSMDEYFRISSADEIADAGRSMSFGLRPKFDDNTTERSNYQLHELTKAETRPDRKSYARTEEKPAQSTELGSAEKPAATLISAVGSNLIDPDASFLNRLIQRQEKLGGQIILFADVDGAMRCSSTCVQVGVELSARTGKRVLVVDSDTTAQSLSRTVLVEQAKGLTDLVRGDVHFEGTTQGTEKQGVEFLSAGIKPFDFAQSNDLTRENAEKLIGTIRNHYDFICVSMGTAFDSSLRMWGKNCDMTFLTIDPTCTSRSLAKAAVAELQNFGARVEGCITTIVEKN